MHKNRLQELCHKQMWPLPTYTSCLDGAVQNPRFRASVLVNGRTFEAPDLSKSVKEAQNKAAEVALDHLSAIASSAVPAHPTSNPPNPPSGPHVQMSYKTQLQIYVQKRNIGVLKYDSVRVGSAHALRFKAMVTVDGQTFESSGYFNTLREAEHSAANVALMSLPHDENRHDEPNFSKNLLQQLVQKEGLSLPLYNTAFNGASHMPIFTSTVIVEGESFVGAVAKTKKQAEMNAAKVALDCLKERKGVYLMKGMQHSGSPSLKCQENNDGSPSSLKNQISVIETMDQLNLNSISTSTLKIKEDSQAKEQQVPLLPPSDVKIKEEIQANDGKAYRNKGVAKKIYHNFLGCMSEAVNGPDKEILSCGYTYRLNPSHLKLDSNGSAVNNVTVIKDASMVVSNSHNGKSNVNKPHDEIFSSGYADQLDYSIFKQDFDARMKQKPATAMEQQVLSIPPSDVKIKEQKQANAENAQLSGRFTANKAFHKDLDCTNASVSESHNELFYCGYTDLLDLSHLKLDPDESAIKNAAVINDAYPAVNKPHHEIISSGHFDSPLKPDLDARIRQEERRDGASSEDIDAAASIEDANADAFKISNSPTYLCNRVRVYPRNSGMALPAGATLIPFSDGAWVAVSLVFSDHDSDHPTV